MGWAWRWRAEWIGLLEQNGRERDGEREVPVLVAWRPFGQFEV